MKILPRLFLALHLITAMGACAAEDFQYFPATLANTTLADGGALKIVTTPPTAPGEITSGATEVQPNSHWHWRENAGSGAAGQRGLFAAAGNAGNDAPMLRTTVTGLKPKTDYQVFGCFWIGGFVSDAATPAGKDLWDIRLGCGIAEMMGYGLKSNTGFPVTLGCGTKVPWKDGISDRDGDKRLCSASLGIVRTDMKGSLVVYVDDQAEDANAGRTWFDGVCLLPAVSKVGIGTGAPGALHRAVRCGDWEMVRRELEAGSELNALDLDGLTPLFYACVDPDLKRIEALLKSGASPDVEGQTLSPLWAAATEGRVDLAELLLNSGANIPLDPLPPDLLRKKFKIIARSHPAVAAIYSGSLKVLKILLKKMPKLDLDRLFASDYEPMASDGRIAYPYAVLDAVVRNHPDMAEYLIDLGCQIEGPEFGKNLPERASWNNRSENTTGSRGLLIAAVMAGPPMHGVVKALARRGVKLVDDNFVESRFVVPWDALSAAALAGDAELTRQLLPTAEGVGQAYKTNLIVLAWTGGNREVITSVENRFGEVRIPRWDGINASRQEKRITDEARVFELRKVPFTPRTQSNGSKVLAVISDPESAGPAAAITAKASAGAGWICVEREQIESLLEESRLAKPWDDVAQDLSSLGDRLAADLLIVVSRLKSEQLSLLRIEAIDVRSGLPIDRLHLDEKEFKPDSFCENYLADIRRRLDERLSGKETMAITLLPITVDPSLGESASLEGMLHAGILQKIDQTSGMIALTRDQMQPLAEEKILGQSGKLWGAAWTIEGGLSPLDGIQVELALRVRSLGKDGQTRDVKASGSADDLQSLVKEAWAQIPAIIRDDPSSKALTPDTPEQRAGTEAARLVREAEWLHNIKRDHDAASLIDAALFLGADPLKTNLLRMNIHMSMRNYWVWGRYTSSSAGPTQITPEMPMSTLLADEAAHHLGEYLELLRVNSESLNRVEKLIGDQANYKTSKGPLADFWWNLDTLVFYRSVLQPGLMTSENAGLLREFDRELERHVKRLFALIKPDRQGCELLLNADEYSFMHFKAVPALSDALAEAIVRIFDSSNSGDNYSKSIYNNYFAAPSFQSGKGLIPGRIGMMCDSLEKAVIKCNSPFRNLRMAEIRFLRSSGDQRTVAARELLDVRIQVLSSVKKLFSDWVPAYNLGCWSPMPASDSYYYPADDLRHGDSLIPSLIYTSVATPDQIFRQSQYSAVAAQLFSIRQKSASARLYTGAKIADQFETRLNLIVSNSEPASQFDRLLSSAHLMDRLMGVDIALKLEPKILRLRPNEIRKHFGSKSQFPVLEFEGAVDGKFLTDVRSGITDKPAMFTHPMVDPKNRHILWLVLEPYEERDFKLAEQLPPSGSVPSFAAGQPWLLAVDCRDGRTLHQINLAKASGFSGATSNFIKFGDLINTDIFSNDTHLLVQMVWYSPKRVVSTLLINRETGGVEKLPDPLLFQYLHMPGNGSSYNAVVGVGDSFFIVQTLESEGTILWRVKSGEDPGVLAKSGRRPEQSPFDAQDREIRYLTRTGGKLLAASSWGRFSYFDLKSGTWSTDPERTEKEGKAFLAPINRKEYHATLFPQHLFKHEDGSVDAFAGPMDTESGRLKFQNGGGPLHYLPVSLRPPDSYRARFQVLSPLPSGAEGNLVGMKNLEYDWINTADLARSSFTKSAIMNQTDVHFVLGTRIDYSTSNHLSKQCYLPFLWSIDKPAMLTGMKNAKNK
jgi:hypothetical protein